MEYANFWCRVTISVIFIMALWGKFSPNGFSRLVAATAKLAPALSRVKLAVTALTLALQVLIVGLLIFSFDVEGFSLALLLLLVFTATLIRAVRLKANYSCACFGSSNEKSIGMRDVVRNVILILIASLGLATSASPSSLERASPEGLVLTLAMAFTAAVLIARNDEISFLLGFKSEKE